MNRLTTARRVVVKVGSALLVDPAAGQEIRRWVVEQPLPPALEEQIRAGYAAMEKESGGPICVAVRSSATRKRNLPTRLAHNLRSAC